MDSLEQIKSSLRENPNIDDNIRDKFYTLINLFHKKLPNINLDKLNNKIKTVKIKKMSRFERKGTYYYDVFNNTILFSNSLSLNYDIDNLLMKAILEMATSNNFFTGFQSDEKLKALNCAYTEILANYIVGNEGESDLEEEMLITNLLSHIVGKEVMFNSYFTNNGDMIIKALQESEVGML